MGYCPSSLHAPLNTQVQLPGYLKSLPLPRSFGRFYDLTRNEWLELVPFILFLITFLYIILSPFVNFLTQMKKPRPRINRKQRLSEGKVVDTFDIEDLGDKTAYCRCWKSNKVYTCGGWYSSLVPRPTLFSVAILRATENGTGLGTRLYILYCCLAY